MSGGPRSLVRAATALVVGLLLAIPVVLTTATPAFACRCAVAGVAQQARAADLVVAGTAVEVTGGDARDGRQNQQDRPRRNGQRGGAQPQRDFGNVTLVIEIDRIYRGEVADPRIEVTTAAQSSACGLGRLPVDERYYFFLTADGPTLRATSCGGTGPATDQQTRAIVAAVGEGRPVTEDEPTPPPVERTVVGDQRTVSLPMAVAPGGVLLAIGLIGLAVLGGLGSRR